jgi:hypothetical protein
MYGTHAVPYLNVEPGCMVFSNQLLHLMDGDVSQEHLWGGEHAH